MSRQQGIPGREGHIGAEGLRGPQGERGPAGPIHHRTMWDRVQPVLGYIVLVTFLVASLAIFRAQEADNLERIRLEEKSDIERLERESIARKTQVCEAVEATRRLISNLLISLSDDLSVAEAAHVTDFLNADLCFLPDPPIIVPPSRP